MKTRGIPATALGLACLLPSLLALSPATAGDAGRPALSPVPDEMAARLGHLTLDDAIDIALRRNPDILRQLQEIQRNQGIILQVRSAALPQLIIAGTFNQTDRNLAEGGATTGTAGPTTGTATTTTTTGGTTTGTAPSINNLSFPTIINGTNPIQAGPSIPLKSLFGSTETVSDKNYTVQFEVQQTFYNAAIPPAVRQAKLLRDAAYYNLRETVDTTINVVKTDFYTVLVDQALIEIQNENLRLLQSQLTDQQNRFAAGTVPRFDVLQASVAVANQRPMVITATNNLSLSYIGLMRTLGLEYGPEQEKRAPLKLVGNLDYHPQTFDPAAGVAAGKANRALLKGQRLVVLSNVEQVRIGAAGYQPTLVGTGGYELENDRLSDNLGQTLHGWFYGANFNWNVFDGLNTYGRVKQYQALLRESRITYLDDVNSVVEDIQNNFLSLQQSKELIASQVLNVSEAEEAVRLSQARLSAGAGTQLDVLTSQTQLLTAQTTELQARYNYAVALGNYERVTGTSTVYDEAFYDPLTNRRQPTGRDKTGTTILDKPLPLGTIKTPDTVERGSGKPLKGKINAEDPKRAARPAKPLDKREYILQE